MRKFTTRSLIYDTMNIHRIAGEKRRKTLIFRTFSTPREIFILSEIGEREVIPRIILHFPLIHRYVRRIFKDLITPKVP